jgi:monofunctional chorismate mutase
MEDEWWNTIAKKALESKESLENLRQRIDTVDAEIAALLEKRLALTKEIAEAKASLQISVRDATREQQVLNRVRSASQDLHVSEAIAKVYESIFECSRELQMIAAQQMQLQAAEASKATLYFPKITIFGMGLIGGSIARLVKRHIPQTVIVGVDADHVTREALDAALIDSTTTDCKKAVAGSTLIILAAPPDQNLKLLAEIAPHLRKRQLVTDVTSVKGPITSLAEELNLGGADFIGGHPFFGSEKSGLAASAALRAEGSLFCVCPTKKSSEISLRRLLRWLALLRMRTEVLDALTHDRTVARTSHLIQLMAVLLGDEIAHGHSQEELRQMLKLSGPSLKQLSRLMRSPSQLWTQILGQNHAQVAGALKEIVSKLSPLIDDIEQGKFDSTVSLFESASRVPQDCP